MRVDNSNGIGILHVLNSQRVAIGSNANEGTFNVTGTTFLTDELTIRNATLTGNTILRFWKYQDNGVLDIYDGTTVINRINAKGTSYFNGGFIGLNITAPTARLDINGDLRVRNIPAGSVTADEVLTTDANGFFRKVPVSALGGSGGSGDVTGVTAAGGLTGGGTSGDLVIAASANNGLTVDAAADKIQIGGTLVKATTIDHGIYTMTHNLTGSGDFQVADNGVMKFSILDNGRVAINGTNTAGQFNVTGDSYHSDDIYLRDGSVTGTNLLRLFDNGDEGVIDWYNAGSVQNRITAQGNSYINGGNLGIGTTNPSEKLHVQGNMRVSALAGSGNRMVVADANGALFTQAIPNGGGSGTGDIDGVNAGAGVSGGGTSGTVTINALANNGLNVDAPADRIQLGGALTEQTTIFQSNNDMNWDLTGTGDFKINDSGITKFAVNDNGRVSVGSNAHSGTFNVTGQSYFSDDLIFTGDVVNSGNRVAILSDRGSVGEEYGVLQLYASNSVSCRISGSSDSYISNDFSGGNGSRFGTFNVGSTDKIITTYIEHTADDISARALKIFSKAIGTSYHTGSEFYLEGQLSGPGSTALRGVLVDINAALAERKIGMLSTINLTGTSLYAYGIETNFSGTSSAIKYGGYFNGDVYTTGSYLPSHSSLKNNINLVDNGLSRLMKIQVKEYEYKKKGLQHMNLPEGTQTGVIAEELKEIYPELVKRTIQPEAEEVGGKEIEFEAVNYTGLVPHLIKGMQEQQAKIEDFEKKEALQNQKIERLEKLVEQLLNERPSSGALNNN